MHSFGCRRRTDPGGSLPGRAKRPLPEVLTRMGFIASTRTSSGPPLAVGNRRRFPRTPNPVDRVSTSLTPVRRIDGPKVNDLGKEDRMRVVRLVGLVAALVLTAAPITLLAQTDTGSLDGRIFDEQKGGVPGVTVTAKNTATGLTRSVQSGATGTYHFPSLPAGTYDLTAEIQGFSQQVRKGVIVQVASQTSADFTMRVGRRHRDRGRHGRDAAGADDEVGRRAGHHERARGQHAAERPEVPGPVAPGARHAQLQLLRPHQDRGRAGSATAA